MDISRERILYFMDHSLEIYIIQLSSAWHIKMEFNLYKIVELKIGYAAKNGDMNPILTWMDWKYLEEISDVHDDADS